MKDFSEYVAAAMSPQSTEEAVEEVTEVEDIVEEQDESVLDEPESSPPISEETVEEQEEVKEPEPETETVGTQEKKKRTPDDAMRDYRVRAENAEKGISELKTIAEMFGASPEDILRELKEQAYQRKAEVEQVPVEKIKETEKSKSYEEEIRSLRADLEAEKSRQVAMGNIAALQREYSLTEEETTKFIQDAYTTFGETLSQIALNKDALVKLYVGVNADKIFEKKRQEQLAAQQRKQKSTPLPVQQTPSTKLSEKEEALEAAKKLGKLWAGL